MGVGYLVYGFYSLVLYSFRTVRDFLRSLRGRQWPSAEAKVDRCLLTNKAFYRVEIFYSYYWDGTLHSGRVMREFAQQPTAQRVAKQFGAGQTVFVHVQPERPEDSFLDLKVGYGWSLLLALGTVYFLAVFAWVGITEAMKQLPLQWR